MGCELGVYKLVLPPGAPSLAIKVRQDLAVPEQVVGVYAPIHLIDPILKQPTLVPLKYKNSPSNIIAATMKRFGTEMPPSQSKETKLFTRFSKAMIRFLYPETSFLNHQQKFTEWVGKYPGGRAAVLTELRAKIERITKDFIRVKSFIKDESYDELKFARAINSICDEYKVLLGPLMGAIEELLFADTPTNPYFVKHSNPKTWPKRMRELFKLTRVAETDFSSFEAHHKEHFSEIFYYLMLHLTRNISDMKPYKVLMARLIKGRNIISFHNMRVEIDQRLMSGALWTSSANGIMNLLTLMYLQVRSRTDLTDPDQMVKWVHSNFRGLVEGDDGIMSAPVDLDQKVISDLGLKLKLDYHNDFSEAKFCGITCDPAQLTVLKNPIAVMRRFFLLPKRYRLSRPSIQMGLLRARALSYLYTFHDCPIVGPMAYEVCRLTRSYKEVMDPAVTSYHCPLNFKKDLDLHRMPIITDESRNIVSVKYNVPLDAQLRIERAFSQHVTGPLALDLTEFVDDFTMNHALNFVTKSPDVWAQPPTPFVPKIVQEILRTGELLPTVKSSKTVVWADTQFQEWINCGQCIMPPE